MNEVNGWDSERFLQEGNAFWFDGKPADALAAYEKAVEALAEGG